MLVVLAGSMRPVAAGATADKSSATGVTLSGSPLGIDVAQWDPVYSNPATLNSLQSYLTAAGINQIHYGGGVTSDQYDWQTDVDITQCAPDSDPAEYTAACAEVDPLDFAQLSQNARAIGAQTSVTVNYGSGSAALAAAWVTQSLSAGQGVGEWTIGNESYGCWEVDNELTEAPADDPGYEPNDSATCPWSYDGNALGVQTMADSYAQYAGQFMAAMKAADPDAQIGVPWAFDGGVQGATVPDNDEWNDTVLGDDGADISYVDAHWYPFTFGGDIAAGTIQTVLQSVETIPGEYNEIQSTLNTYDPSAKVIIGETGVSYLATNLTCTPAGAVFAAGDVLEWLAAGAQTVDWWPMDTSANANYPAGGCQPDEGMFTSPANANAQPQPLSPYYGYLLASVLAQPNARLTALTTTNPSEVLGFQSVLPNGQVAVALINTSTSVAEQVQPGTSLTGNFTTETYSAAGQNSSNSRIVDGYTTAGAVQSGITIPAESIVVLKSYTPLPSAMTLGPAVGGSATKTGVTSTFKAGTKVTLTGKLTLDGAAAPAGEEVTIYRKMPGTTKNAATLTARTVSGGTFTVTDVTPTYGSYVYAASFTNPAYTPSSASASVRVVRVKPAIKVAVSAKSVRPGTKVRVTATLGAWHNNRTLVIYAEVAGHAKAVIAHGKVNSKGQLSVVYTVRANTTFLVTYPGDAWYAPASATGRVKA